MLRINKCKCGRTVKSIKFNWGRCFYYSYIVKCSSCGRDSGSFSQEIDAIKAWNIFNKQSVCEQDDTEADK